MTLLHNIAYIKKEAAENPIKSRRYIKIILLWQISALMAA